MREKGKEIKWLIIVTNGSMVEWVAMGTKKLGDGKEIFLGLCEGHGTRVFLYRYGSQLYIEHATNGAIEWKPQPARSKMAANKLRNRTRKKTVR